MTDRQLTAACLARLAFALVAGALGLAAPAQAQEGSGSGAEVRLPARSFPACCPRPEWWADIGEVPRIMSMQSFDRVWRDGSLRPEQKAKALYQAIEDHWRRNDEITAAAVTYFFSVGRDYPNLRELTEFGLARYLDYDRPLIGYSGKPGDLTAGMVRNLSGLYIAEGEPALAVPPLRYILENRRAEVNDHLLELNALNLGRALAATGREAEAVEVLVAAVRDLSGDWEGRLEEELGELRGRMGPEYYLHDRRLSGPALLLLIGALLAWSMFRRRPRRI